LLNSTNGFGEKKKSGRGGMGKRGRSKEKAMEAKCENAIYRRGHVFFKLNGDEVRRRGSVNVWPTNVLQYEAWESEKKRFFRGGGTVRGGGEEDK